ncbi:MAG: YibE/F family protein [Kiritimatiellae bacterium]|nr:YibE/F family protein [Kiritimatiellia bacterium]
MNAVRIAPLGVLAAACAAMWLLPPAAGVANDGGVRMRAKIAAVDNSALKLTGLLEYGTQGLEVEMLEGPARGERFHAANEMRAQLDIDKKFSPGDVAAVTWPAGGARQGDTLVARDHWRLGWMALLFVLFAALLTAFGGWTGVKALFSFAFACFAVWKVMVPLCLGGWSASWTAFAVVSILAAVIMYLVAGATRKGVAAFFGAMTGVAASLALAHFFSKAVHVNGATMPFVQALMYSGYSDLDMADVFAGAVILASSGAVMDLAMDIAAGVGEVSGHNPELPRRELFLSGVRIGRSVVGTMTTTLLLAYSGGYLTLLMVFAAQGTAPLDFINSTLVSAEVVKTLVGSFGLVLVAPATAAVSAWTFSSAAAKAKGGVDHAQVAG